MSDGPRALVVLGMHRSGTSILARVLHELGANALRSLLEPTDDNPDGYMESVEVVSLDNRLLEAAGLRWFDQAPMPPGFFDRFAVRRLKRRALQILRDDLPSSDTFVLKDPRFCRLVPFWSAVLEAFGATPHWILVLRHPLEVVRSLAARDLRPETRQAAVVSESQACLLWLRYSLEAERQTRGAARTIVLFDDLLRDWRTALRRAEGTGIPFLGEPDPVAAQRVDALLSPTRPRSRQAPTAPPGGVEPRVADAYETLRAHAHGEAPLAEGRLDDLLTSLDEGSAAYRRVRPGGERLRSEDRWARRELSYAFERATIRSGIHGRGEVRRVLFLSGAPDSVGHLYRVRHHIEALRSDGIPAVCAAVDDAASLVSSVRAGDVLIVYRAPWSESLAGLVDRCRSEAVPVGFDVDDLLFEPESLTPQLFDHLRRLSPEQRAAWQSLSHGLRETLTAADFGVFPTAELVSRAETLGTRCFALRSALGARALTRAARASRRAGARARDGRIRIGYASGTTTHQRDFAVVVPALADVLASEPRASLRVVGHLDLGEFPQLDPLADRIEPRPAVSYRDLLDEIAHFDVCIAPLEVQNPFCRAKSELKYVEAGAVGIPTVASDTPAFRTAIEDGLNGCLVRDPETWEQALRMLIEDAGERHRMGSEAQRHVAGCYGPEETRRSASLLRRWIR
jgi:glycosyltransferase involved in cell wall biosynthesis